LDDTNNTPAVCVYTLRAEDAARKVSYVWRRLAAVELDLHDCAKRWKCRRLGGSPDYACYGAWVV
jgi:hypothetical protein